MRDQGQSISDAGISTRVTATAPPFGRVLPPPPSLSLVTLRLHPKALEGEFWISDASSYVSLDRWALPLEAVGGLGAILMFFTCLEWKGPLAVMIACTLPMIAISASARLWLARTPESYIELRQALMVVRHIYKSLYFLMVWPFTPRYIWIAQFMERTAAPYRIVDVQKAMLSRLALMHVMMGTDCLLFPVAFMLAVPLQVVHWLVYWRGITSFVCTVHSFPLFHTALSQLCSSIREGRMLLTMVAQLMVGAPDGQQVLEDGREVEVLCKDAYLELLLPLIGIPCCLAPLYILYNVERSLKLNFLKARGHRCTGVQRPGWVHHLLAMPLIFLATWEVAQTLAMWGPRYACS